MDHISEIKIVKIEGAVECKQEIETEKNITTESVPKIKEEYDDIHFNEKTNNFAHHSTSNYNSNILETILVKPEVESEIEENYELSQSDIEKEFEAFNKEDEKKHSGKTILENNTTAYKCQICENIFQKFFEYKDHKRNHFIEKRRFVSIITNYKC